jgi:hypothetical protein
LLLLEGVRVGGQETVPEYVLVGRRDLGHNRVLGPRVKVKVLQWHRAVARAQLSVLHRGHRGHVLLQRLVELVQGLLHAVRDALEVFGPDVAVFRLRIEKMI